jgi:hypothetical protein
LPAAIGLHINGDALYKSINLPVHQLNYNAVPQEFIGRIRALSDGLIYSLGLTLAGVLLWICHIYLNLVQITWLAASLTVILLLVRLPMGHFYARGLEEMIRSDAINLDDFNDYQTQLPPESHTVIRELLRDGDRYMQIKGLDLAASLGHPSQFLPEVKALLSTADAKLRQGIVKLFSVTPDTEALKQFESLLKENNQSILRATALEILITNQYGFEQKQLDSLLEDRDPEIRSLAQIAASLRETNEKKEIKEVWSEIFQSQLAENTVKAIIRVVAYSNKRELVPLL